MAKLSFGVTGPTGSLDVSITIADTDMPRIMAYLMSGPHGSVTENVITDVPDASWAPGEDQTEADRPTTQVQGWVTRQATMEETAASYARSVLDSLLSQTVAYEKAQAAAAAAAAVTPIEPILA